MQLSYWEKESFFEQVDACVIGSGIVGLSAAIELKKIRQDWNVLVLERGFLPYGASTRNAGFACFGSVTELQDDLLKQSEKDVFSLVEWRWKGLQNLRNLLGDENIGFCLCGGYELFTTKDEFEKAYVSVHEFNRICENIIGKEVYSDASQKINDFGFKNVSGMILNRYEAQVNTGKMMKNLLKLAYASGVTVMNGVDVETINGKSVKLKNGIVFDAGKIIITVNGFAKQFLPELDVEPARAQVLVTSEINDLPFEGTFHYEKGYYYFRNVGKRVLFGGGRNLDFDGERTTDMGQTLPIQNQLESLLRGMILPGKEYKIEQRWSGIMGVGSTRSPIVKQISENLFCAVRMGGMGVAIGSLVGKEVAELTAGSDSRQWQ
ncbi:MAG: NAD(P)/FAD-dependent oxidoreductase [Bacteroidota bacterium]